MIKPLTPEQQQLAKTNIPLAKSLVRKYRKQWRHLDVEEMLSAAYLALTKAASSFDPQAGYKFSAFFSRCLESEWAQIGPDRHYIRIPQHYGPDRQDQSGGYPADRERAKKIKREGRINRDGVDLLDQHPDVRPDIGWAYEVTAQLPEPVRVIAERILIQGHTHEAVRASLKVGVLRYKSLRGLTCRMLQRLIDRNQLSRDSA
jgi:Sigma-70 region 2